MRAYVIKNKEGKIVDHFGNTIDRTYVELYNDRNFAKQNCPNGCNVVAITIAEGDLEQQLAEKDKEIEKYKQQCYDCKHLHKKLELNIKNKLINDIENLRAEKRDYERIIRHQVCQEIRERALDLYYFTPNEVLEHFGGNFYLLSKYDLEEILDQIEKGE